jgi:hypothetical protein
MLYASSFKPGGGVLFREASNAEKEAKKAAEEARQRKRQETWP